MKFSNKISMLAIAGMIICSQQLFPKTAEDTVTAAIVAQTESLESKMYKCAEKHLPYFSDLTIGNVKTKIKHIELLRKELLELIEKAPKHERSKYSQLEAILSNFNVQEVFKSIQDFKQILARLPQNTSNLIKTNLNDRMTRTVLGL